MTRTLKMYALRMDRERLDALKAIKRRDGISESEQIRRAIDLWLKAKGVRRRSGTKTPGRKGKSKVE